MERLRQRALAVRARSPGVPRGGLVEDGKHRPGVADAGFLAEHAQGILTDDEQKTILWAKPARSVRTAKWSAADAVLIAERQTERGTAAHAVKGERPVYFQGDGFVSSTVYDRARLRWGATFAGPAIVEQWDSTTVVPPGAVVDVDEYLNLVIRVRPETATAEERR